MLTGSREKLENTINSFENAVKLKILLQI
jgi:hypothetical protein